jgi:sterol desaturase/sphingolipid hydroxylase (fatty acid hydroxylase superfamily)
MSFPNPIAYAVPVFVLTIMAEAAIARRRGRAAYELRDTAASMLLGLGNLAVGTLSGIALFGIYGAIYRYRLVTLPDSVVALAAAFVAYDFCYYWSHRWSHQVRLGWASHRVHHSSQHFNLAAALRQSWIDLPTLLAWLPFLPLPLLGFSPPVIFFVGGLSLIYSYFQHTEHVSKLPAVVEYIFATPSHHRVHHAINPRYLDMNYGNTFIIWDRLFGTFTPEASDAPCRYGMVHNVASFNPAVIALGELAAIAQDIWRAPGWRSRAAYVFGPPGYSHDGTRQTARGVKFQAREQELMSVG